MTMYHATPAKNVDAIVEGGLEARTLNMNVRELVSEPEFDPATGRVEGEEEVEIHDTGVYVTSKRKHAERYVKHLSVEHYWDGDEHEFVVLELDVSRLDDRIFNDPEDMGDDPITASGYVFADDIPAEDISVVGEVVA